MRRNHSYPTTLFFFLILSMLFSLLTPFWNDSVEAGSPDGHTVYLPLVSKNYQEWLDIFNQYRAVAGLPPVTSNDSMNYGLSLHTKYMLLNPGQKDWHTEYSDKPGYTEAGKLAASQSNILWSNSPTYSVKQSIDLWMATARHRYHMLNPYLAQSGFSLACDGINCFAGLNVIGGIVSNSNVVAVTYPGEDQTNIPPSRYPITISFFPSSDQIKPISVSKFTLFNNNGVVISTDRLIYDDYVKEVVITPKNTLLPNHRYRVEVNVTAGEKIFIKTWYFTTGQ